jgi:hypothetical protein
LNLDQGKSGFLFVHDANSELQLSTLCMYHHVELMSRYGGRGFWIVIINSNASHPAAAHFKLEAQQRPRMKDWARELGPVVLETSAEAAVRMVGDTMLAAPRLFPPIQKTHEDAMSDLDFLHQFFWGCITPFRHKDYLRAAFLVLTEPDIRELSILDIATKFAGQVHRLKQKSSQIQLQPESR